MKKINQRHVNGCAIASIAMVSGRSYAEVFRAAHGKKRKRQYGALYLDRILYLLNKFGIRYGITYNAEGIDKCVALISIKVKGEPNMGHMVVYNKGEVLDPWDGSRVSHEGYEGVSERDCKKRFFRIIKIKDI